MVVSLRRPRPSWRMTWETVLSCSAVADSWRLLFCQSATLWWRQGLASILDILAALKVPGHATRCGVINRYKSFWKSFPYDITDGLVHLEVCWIDQSTSLPSGL